MIKDKYERERALKLFGGISHKAQTEIEQEYMPHYLIYKRKGQTYDCYCTHCREHYSFTRKKSREWLNGVMHKGDNSCLKCGYPVVCLSSGMSRKNIRDERNFAVFSHKNGALLVECVKFYGRFEGDELVFGYDPRHRYYISVGAVQHWNLTYKFVPKSNSWVGMWNECESENEPYFGGMYYADTGYTLVNEETVHDTSMLYAERCIENADSYSQDVFCNHYIAYLCEFAKHPNVEYLIKTGFGFLVSEKLVNGNRHGLRINWRSNDPKKMLKLSKEEMKLLSDKSCDIMNRYLWYRQELKNPQEAFDAVGRYDMAYVADIKDMTGLSVRKIINYIEKQKTELRRTTLITWRDYLNGCKKLGYDLSDSLVNRPKNIDTAHDRVYSIIKFKASENLRIKSEARKKELEKLAYTDEKRGLQVIIPENAQGIITEGKVLNHCVGGYAERHADGALAILFLRTIQKPDVPYYTIEVDNSGQIIQCRGFKNNTANNPKPQAIKDFEAEYQQYLNKIFKRRKTA